MSGTDIGGFWAALGIKLDRDSFDRAHRAIDNTSNSLNHLITTLKAAATAMGIDKLTAMESQELYTADAIGISAEELDKWQIAAGIAGAKASGLTSALGKLNSAFIDAQWRGKMDESMAMDFQQLGLSWNSMVGMDSSERMAAILDAASKHENQALAKRLVSSLLGSDGLLTYQYMMKYEEGSVEKLLKHSSLLDFTTPESKDNSAEFQKELGELKTTIAQISLLGIGELAEPLTMIVAPLNDWLQTHGEDIQKGLENLADWIVKLIERITFFYQSKEERLAANAELRETGAKTTADGLYDYYSLSEDMKKKVDERPDIYGIYIDKTQGNNFGSHSANMMSTPTGFSAPANLDFDAAWETLKGQVKSVWGHIMKINDGIVSPTGQVTQVAPDDWVIAARDLSNLGAAFMPQTTQAAGDVILNQTINVSGNVSPSTVKQQAYVGARGGLLEAIEHSTQRFQLMPQTR